VVLSLLSSTMQGRTTIAPNYNVRPDSHERAGFGQSVALGRAAGPGTLLIGAPGTTAGDKEASGRVYLWRASEGGAELIQTLDGSAEGAQLGSTLLATGRWKMWDEFLASTPFGGRELLRRGQLIFDNDALDFRAEWGSAPEAERPSAFAHGDFDGSGSLDLAVGIPEESTSARAPAGGYFEVWRRTDEGEWADWGRYRQGE
jgi:hypothetical protein